MAWSYTYTYSQVNDYSAKDALASGQAEKIILGADIDDELSGIATALNLKLDPGSVASTAEAQAGSDTESVMTPNSVTEWSNSTSVGGGHVGELWSLADPAADRILFYDFSAGAGSMLSQLTVGTGLAITATTLATNDAGIDHDALSNFVADEHVAHSGVTITAGAGLTGGGTIDATRTLDVGAGSGITVNANDVAITDVTAGTTNPINISSGTFSFRVDQLASSLDCTTIAGADLFLVDDGAGGTNKKIAYQDMGFPTTTIADGDFTANVYTLSNLNQANRLFLCTKTTAGTFTVPANASVAYPIGTVFTLFQSGAGQITFAVTTDTLRSPNGTKTFGQYSVATLIKTGTTEWVLTGDTTT